MSEIANLPPTPPSRHLNLTLIAAIGFGLGTLLFGLIALVSFSSASSARHNLNQAKDEAKKSGAAEQKKADDDKYLSTAESPYRSYIAPDIFGAFKIFFPKNWSLYVVEGQSSNAQLSLILHPDMIKVVQSGDNAYALQVQLSQTLFKSQQKTYQDMVKAGKLKGKDITVSGIAGNRFEGKVDSKHDGVVVIIPLRDKTLSFTMTDKTYQSEFDQVLAKTQISP
jgi:hypothetical protein